MSNNTVSIKPGIGIYNVIRHTNYSKWTAISEFIDNSVQSYLENRVELEKLNENFQLNIFITFKNDFTSFTITDNAAGIADDRFEVAFRPAKKHLKSSGLNEFGLGMKSASFWFANKWEIKTKALSEDVIKKVSFDIDKIMNDNLSELDVEKYSLAKDQLKFDFDHGTQLDFFDLTDNKIRTRRDLTDIKKHLSSIYRRYIDPNSPYKINIWLDRDVLKYKHPKILVAPHYEKAGDPKAKNIEWKVHFDLELEGGKRIKGKAALLEKMSASANNGFSIFRRGRVIQGSGDEKFRPEQWCGPPGQFLYKRLCGEVEIFGFDVTYDKGAFHGQNEFDKMIDLVKHLMEKHRLQILKQGRNYRVKDTIKNQKNVANKAIDDFDKVAENRKAIKEFEKELSKIDVKHDIDKREKIDKKSLQKNKINDTTFQFMWEQEQWNVNVLISSVESSKELISYSIEKSEGSNKELQIVLNSSHHFMKSYGHNDIAPYIRIAVALCISEIITSESGVIGAGLIRKYINNLLSTELLGN